jgi:hypothetical protein
MSERYVADVFDANGNLMDTLEVGGDDGSLPPTVMSPDTAREELEQLARDEYGDRVHRLSSVRVRGSTS